MRRLLEGKVALVTGGSSGIGRATARAFAREGARVVVADINPDGGQETVQMIKQQAAEAIFIRTDVSRSVEVQALIEKAIEAYGRLDCAFNNAGVAARGARITDQTEEDWDRIVGINLKGVWLCMKYEIPQMLRGGGGAIVNTSSIGGLVGFPNTSPYTASKHGVVGLTKCAALEYAKDGIRVNAVCPGAIQTPMIERRIASGREPAISPMERIGSPEEVAQAVVWLCSDAASLITGHALPVDGGYVAR